jgi:hypothetical protein
MNQMRILFALIVVAIVAGSASADTQWSQVSWFVAESVAHTISYGVYNTSLACTQTALYYVEPAPVTGTRSKLNASTDQSGLYKCQNSTQGVLKIYNTGSVGINLTASFNQITSGVRMKIATSDNGWQILCNGVCDAGSCNLTSSCIRILTSPSQIAYNMAQNTSKEYWMWADFKSVAGTVNPTKGNLTTTAVKYG